MKYIFVQVGPIANYPPALSALQTLNDLGKEVILITTQIDAHTMEICKQRHIKVIEVLKEFPENIHPALKMLRLFSLKKKLWQEIDRHYDAQSILWISSDPAITHLGSKLLKRKYILHMFELGENIIYYSKLPFLKMDTSKYAHHSLANIQAEYNRAHIAKTWWNLKDLPFILPNKPYTGNYSRNMPIQDKTARDIIEKLSDKKIILYQGITSKERPLDKIISAVAELGDEYAFVLMSGEQDVYADMDVDNYYFIPFVKPPFHLEITSHAHIGVLSYHPTANGYSKLNALFCAPNKIYEYAAFGIPMIGNDIPGLTYPFNTEQIGATFNDFNVSAITNAIKQVEDNFLAYSQNTIDFYHKTDTRNIILEITEFAEKAFDIGE